MRYIKNLSNETLSILSRIYKQSKYYQVRQRAHCLKLSHEGYQIVELMKIFKVSRNTIYNWFNSWENSSLAGLYNERGRGRKKIFNKEQQSIIREWVKATPKSLDKVKNKIEKNWGIKVSKDTIKRVVKLMKMKWHRIKKRVGDEPIPEFYQKKIEELKELKEQESRGEIEIRYVDESGFCLNPYVPYAWQLSQEKIEIKSKNSKRLNVLGLLTRCNKLEAYTFECSINSDIVIACLDDFSQKITKKTVLIMDNCSVHQNNLLWDREKEWAKKGLIIFFLPTYSPHLNIIEILWRFIKYKWLEIDAYESYSTLVEAVEKIIKLFGTEYTINFA